MYWYISAIVSHTHMHAHTHARTRVHATKSMIPRITRIRHFSNNNGNINKSHNTIFSSICLQKYMYKKLSNN